MSIESILSMITMAVKDEVKDDDFFNRSFFGKEYLAVKFGVSS